MPLNEQLRVTLSKIEELLHNLEADAVFDGTFSTEEKNLIRRIFEDAQNLDKMIHRILEDDLVTPQEKSDFMKYSIQIKYNAELVAGMDGKISEDEKNMLVTLGRFMDTLPI